MIFSLWTQLHDALIPFLKRMQEVDLKSWDNDTDKDERLALTVWPGMSLGILRQSPELSNKA